MDAAYSLLKDDETKFCSLMQEDECNMHMKEVRALHVRIVELNGLLN